MAVLNHLRQTQPRLRRNQDGCSAFTHLSSSLQGFTNGGKSAGRILRWNVTDGGKTYNILSCLESDCVDLDNPLTNKGYFKGRKNSSGGFSSSLKFLNIQAKSLGWTVVCYLHDGNTKSSRKVDQWNMSELYRPLEQATCEAKKSWPNQVNITCRVPHALAGITCNFFEYKSVSSPLDGRKKQELHFRHQNISSCSGLVSVSLPGDYKYTVKIYPRVARDHLEKVPFLMQDTNVVSFDPEPSVLVVQQDTLRLCPGLLNNITCEASMFPSAPTVTATLNGYPLPSAASWNKEEKSGNKVYFRKSVVVSVTQDFLTDHQLKDSLLVKCMATSDSVHRQEDTKVLEVMRPPVQRPKFQYPNDSDLQDEVHVTEENITLTCKVDGGQPSASVSVQCRHLNDSNHFLDRDSNTNSLTFSLSHLTKVDGTVCRCWARHLSGCYDSETSVTFNGPRSTQAERSSQQPDMSHDSYIIGYIIAAVVGFAVFVVILGILMNVVHRWPNLYYYAAGSASVNGTYTAGPSYSYETVTETPRDQLLEAWVEASNAAHSDQQLNDVLNHPYENETESSRHYETLPYLESTTDGDERSLLYDDDGTLMKRVVEGAETSPYIQIIPNDYNIDSHHQTQAKQLD